VALFEARFGWIGGELREWARAFAEFNVMEQGSRTDDEYARYVQELYTILGDSFQALLASTFVYGIKDLFVRKIVYAQLDD
jgi:hypothetical protein